MERARRGTIHKNRQVGRTISRKHRGSKLGYMSIYRNQFAKKSIQFGILAMGQVDFW